MKLIDAYFELKEKEILDKAYAWGDISSEIYEQEAARYIDAEENFYEAFESETDDEVAALVGKGRKMIETFEEISEAEHAAGYVLTSAEEVLKKASSAEGWGIFDLFAGGLITSVIKHDKVADTKAEAEVMKRAIERLNIELDDIKELFNTEGGLSNPVVTVADVLFDGFFIDIYTLGKIRTMKEDAAAVKDRVSNLVTKLQTAMEEIDLELRVLEDELRSYPTIL